MNYRKAIWIAIALTVFALPNNLMAQKPRYKLVDIGTLGGPHSYGSAAGDGQRMLNNSGEVASYADTVLPDPYPFFCFDADCLEAHAFLWKSGKLADLGALPGVNNSAGLSINARGWVAGFSENSIIDQNLGIPEFRATLWQGGEIRDLGVLPGGTNSLGIYANDSGQVIGFSDNGVADPLSFPFFFTGTQIHTFVWENGSMNDIGTLGGPDAITAVSCGGQPRNNVVGTSYVNSTVNAATGLPTLEPFLWKKGAMTSLGSLGGTIGTGQCMNNRGQIIGISNTSGDVDSHAFLWENGAINDLGTLGGPNSEAIWINDAGMIVGSADLPGDNLHDAVVWKGGKIIDLGTVDGDACSRGRGLNSRGQAVGGSSDCRNFLHAFVWEEGGPMEDLNQLIAPGSGWQLTNAFNINDRGEILAKAAPVGFTPNDDEDLGHLVLLIPCDDESESSCGADSAGPVSAQAAAQNGTHAAGTDLSPRPRTPAENVAAWRARFAKQYHSARTVAPKR